MFAGEDHRWLAAMSALTALELTWWAIVWSIGIAPAPRVATYAVLAFACMVVAALLRRAAGLKWTAAGWSQAVAGALLAGIAASAFLPLKYAIPKEVPFWLDTALAGGERSLFGADPWLLLDRTLGWAARPMDWLYATWLPVQSTVLFLVVLARPSRAKSSALIAYSLAWFMLGVVAAVLLSSAGPLFYDRLFGGDRFGSVAATLRARGATLALAESGRMWQSLASNRPGIIAGISAVPSIHVAISLWMALTARVLAPRALVPALAYFLLIWIGSVQLGWHYASDGLAGALGMLAIWFCAPSVAARCPIPASAAPRRAAGNRPDPLPY